MIMVDTGNGSYAIETTWQELWVATWRALSYAMMFKHNGGRCNCGCTVAVCAYCAYECTRHALEESSDLWMPRS